jgi:hypothetical protein
VPAAVRAVQDDLKARNAKRAAALSLGVLLAACGGGGARLSKSTFDARADGVCRKYTSKIDAVPGPKNISQVSAYVDLVKPYIERGVDEIAHLRPPAGLQHLYDRWISSQREALKLADRLRSAAERNDVVGVNAVIKQINLQNKHGDVLAGMLGASVCAQG